MLSKSREQIVLEGLGYEEVEKKKASERRALTRKNGLKKEDALWADTTPGQTRDIVGKKLNMSGKGWEQMKYVYSHKELCDPDMYEAWNTGAISTYKLYTELKTQNAIDKEFDDILHKIERLVRAEPELPSKDMDRFRNTLYGYSDRVKREVFEFISYVYELFCDYDAKKSAQLLTIAIRIKELKKSVLSKGG